MEKYGVMADGVRCEDCDGTGRRYVSSIQWSPCRECGGSGRKSGQINPSKEAAALKNALPA